MITDHKIKLNVYHCLDKDIGLDAYIGIVNEKPSMGIGGCRIKNYLNEDIAKQELISLVSAMHNKARINDINLCGAKCVINTTLPGITKSLHIINY